jgi:uncharacterized protein YdhG (YjbR/CyaY superfamily)
VPARGLQPPGAPGDDATKFDPIYPHGLYAADEDGLVDAVIAGRRVRRTAVACDHAIVRSDSDDVDGYLALVPTERRAVLSRLRDVCRDLLPGFEESMSYGMPAYSRDGSTEIGWASQKRYISLYVLRGDVLDGHRGQLAHLSIGKGCIRYRNPADVDFAVIRSILSAVAASRGPVC